jgi:dTDP-D-glucose 4,6-dehydratase
MTETYEVWFRSPLAIFEKQLANPDFKDEMDWAPKRIFKDGKRQFVDLFSGNWAWEQAVRSQSMTV